MVIQKGNSQCQIDRDRRDEKQVETAEKRCPKKDANGIIIDIRPLDMLSFSYSPELGAENKGTTTLKNPLILKILILTNNSRKSYI